MEEEMIFNNENSFEEEIGDLYRLHYITKSYEHIVEYEKGAWKLFEPSKFIYAFFAFNSFYNFDWEESLKSKKLITCTKKINIEGKEYEPHEDQKYKAMIDFIFLKINDDDKKLFKRNILGSYSIDKTLEIISGITQDKRITESVSENFKKELEKLLKSDDIKIGKLKNEIMWFIYNVRNNIFHGTKDTIQMQEVFQRKRLIVYSNIIIAINELLFKVLEKHTNFKPCDKYRLKNF